MTEYGLIGRKLGHSFSKDIHARLGKYDYALIELEPEQLEAFLREKKFKAINVTIPYKQTVIPFMDSMSKAASEIGAVNCIRNDGGKLTGHNTDFDGLSALIRRLGIGIKGKKVLILGTGGTSDTALAVCRSREAGEAVKVSRSRITGAPGTVTYDEAYMLHKDAQLIINTTPCGMYPNIGDSPLDIDNFFSLEGVADAIYNPIRSRLVTQALQKGIKAEGGLYMLVAQAVSGSEFFLGVKYESELTDRIYRDILSEKTNIVLVGMPGSGKTTAGKAVAEKLGRKFFDMDEVIVSQAGISIPEIFEKYGEEHFRRLETETVKSLAARNGAEIATGGGSIVKKENEKFLKMNGRVVFIDRDLELLVPTPDRPTAFDREQLKRRYEERYDIYKVAADVIVQNNGSKEELIQKIMEEFQ